MNETVDSQAGKAPGKMELERVKIVAMTCLTVFFVALLAFLLLWFKPVWPVAVEVSAISAMATIVCYVSLRGAAK